MEQAVGARESSWKWAHLSISVVDRELGKLVLAKARGLCETKDREGLCVRKVHDDRFHNQYSVFTD